MTLSYANFATSYLGNPLDRPPNSISCFNWASDTSSGGIVYQANYNARAIIVFGSQLTSNTFEFAQVRLL